MSNGKTINPKIKLVLTFLVIFYCVVSLIIGFYINLYPLLSSTLIVLLCFVYPVISGICEVLENGR